MPMAKASLYICICILSLIKENGGHMHIADKTDVILLGNLADKIEGHTFIYGYTLCSTTCHLTDDSPTLSSSPETGGFTRVVDGLPACLQMRHYILAKIFRLQHSSRCVVDHHHITANFLCIDASRNGSDFTCIGKEFCSNVGMAKEVCEKGQPAQVIGNGAGASRYAYQCHIALCQ